MKSLRSPKIAAVAALAAVWLLTPAAAGTPVTYTTGGEAIFTFEAPDDWTIRTGFEIAPEQMKDGETPAPRIVSLQPEFVGGAMWAGLWVPPGLTSVDDAQAFVQALGNSMLSEANVVEQRTETIGGAKTAIYSGHGVTAHAGAPKEVAFDLALMQLPGKVAAAAFIGEAEVRRSNAAVLRGILESMRAAQ